MMRVLDFLVATVYRFTMLIGRRKITIAESVTIKMSSIVLFLFLELAWALLYMNLIDMRIVEFHKWKIFVLSFLTFGVVYILMKRKYLGNVTDVVEWYNIKYAFQNWKIVILFILFWFGGALFFWSSLLFYKVHISNDFQSK